MSKDSDVNQPVKASTEMNNVARVRENEIKEAFSAYSDAQLEELLLGIRRLDEDGCIGAAHSAAVKD